MSVLASTGTVVVPGEILYESLPCGAAEEDHVQPGDGCYPRVVKGADDTHGSSSRKVIMSYLFGVAQWDGEVVSVFPSSHLRSTTAAGQKRARSSVETSLQATLSSSPASPSDAASITTNGNASAGRSVLGPRPHDTVHMRITRVTRTIALGEIIAVNGSWCRHRGAAGGATSSLAAFRGVLRNEDIRPFRVSKEVLKPPPPCEFLAAGDVVVAVVVSQSDVRQYQLSTHADHCGVVESFVPFYTPEGAVGRYKLEHIPGRRDGMKHPKTNAIIPKWTPLIPL